MNGHIKQALLRGRLVLLLGAGASCTSKTHSGHSVPMAEALAKRVAEEAGLEYNDEDLSTVCGAAAPILGIRLHAIYEECFRHCTPSQEYIDLARYPFARIYTLNIDDAFEAALRSGSSQLLNIKSRLDRVSEQDQFFSKLDYIKLNGDINRLGEGFIFSPQEYSGASAKPPLWYEELAKDYFNYTFVFVGTKLKEPLFFHQIERYKGKATLPEQRSYVLVPSITKIEEASLRASNIEFLPGKLADFVVWLKAEFSTPPTPIDILRKSRPELDMSGVRDVQKYAHIFKNVVPVNRASLSLTVNVDDGAPIKRFYKGYKPTWHDILNNVPAVLKKTKLIHDDLVGIKASADSGLICIFGNAGSGKSTVLKQLALMLSESADTNVYFVENVDNNLKELIEELERVNVGKYFVFIERLGEVSTPLAEILKTGVAKKCLFVGAESKSIWSFRVKEHLGEFAKKVEDISYIDDSDAAAILEKIEKYGNWARLGKMSKQARSAELVKKAKKQLLIGLIEATSGEGYDKIVKADYDNLSSDSHRNLLILAGLATFQRTHASEATLTRALSALGCEPNVHKLIKEMDGVVLFDNGKITARHYVYVERLLGSYIDRKILCSIIKAYIEAFCVYGNPIVKNISKSEFAIYKFLVNSRSLVRLLGNNETMILELYQAFEKKLENEGLYLLQYGLALRFFNRHDEAYEKIRMANDAFLDSPQIEHAFAMQKIIMALRVDVERTAMSYFEEAELILSRLDKADVVVFDGYPIVALSEGHVKVVNRFQGAEAAKIIARMYHDNIARRNKVEFSDRLKETQAKLQKFYLSGEWSQSDDDILI